MDGSLAIGKVVLYRLHYFYGVIINEKFIYYKESKLWNALMK